MDRRTKGECIGIAGAVLVHVAVIALLLWVHFAVPQPDESAGGVPVLLGDTEAAQGFDDPSLVDVDIVEDTGEPPAELQPEPPSEDPQELLTQEEEETVALKPKQETPKRKEPTPKETPKKPEKTEAEKLAEARRLAEEKAERERKAAAEAARKNVASAFGKGAQMGGNRGTAAAGKGTEGSATGNSNIGAATGVGGEGTFDLGGRSLGRGTTLPKPLYNVKEEGRVVVNITVNPAGVVVNASINLGHTNTSNQALRKSALDAARKARFEEVDQVGNQMGTITYYFKFQ